MLSIMLVKIARLRQRDFLRPSKYTPRRVVTQAIIRKVDALTSQKNPLPLRDFGKKVHVTPNTVRRIIKFVNKQKRRKTRVHKLATSSYRKKTHPVCARFEEEVGNHSHAEPRHTSEVPRDVSPLDFFGFGYLKRQLFKRRATTQKGVWKVLIAYPPPWSPFSFPFFVRFRK